MRRKKKNRATDSVIRHANRANGVCGSANESRHADFCKASRARLAHRAPVVVPPQITAFSSPPRILSPVASPPRLGGTKHLRSGKQPNMTRQYDGSLDCKQITRFQKKHLRGNRVKKTDFPIVGKSVLYFCFSRAPPRKTGVRVSARGAPLSIAAPRAERVQMSRCCL